MSVPDVIAQARDAMTAKRVYGDPYEKDGVTVIPAAAVRGGAGSGTGESERGQGLGGGFGVYSNPVGAYVIRGDDVRWRAALDWTKIIIGFQLLALGALVVCSRARSRAARA